MNSEPWTIGRLLQWTTDYLRGHGSESPRLDAEVLLAHARGCERIELYTAHNEVAAEPLRSDFRELVRRRATGMPVAYLVGRKEFYSLSFLVTPEVLIPRPETELLIVALLDKAKELNLHDAPCRIADVGTGSGILAVCAAKFLPRASVLAIDTSRPALAVARENAQRHRVAARVEFVEGDLLASLPADATLDFVLSNPPYVSEDEFAALARDVREHEPRRALVAGPKGTEVVSRLVPQAAERLKVGGWLILEISPMMAVRVQELLSADGRFEAIAVHKDLAKHPRVVAARRING